MPREDRTPQPLCADIDGFSLHAAVRVEAHDRKRLEQLWRDGTTHLVMSPLECWRRLKRDPLVRIVPTEN